MGEREKYFTDFFTKSRASLNRIDQETYSTFLRLSLESVDDLESSKILYNTTKFRNSVILLSQAIEKISKANMLLIGVLNQKQALDISHNTPLLQVKLMESDIVQSGLKAFSIELDNPKEFIEVIKKRQQEVISMNESDIDDFLSQYETQKKVLINFYNQLPKKRKSAPRNVIWNWALALVHLYYLSFIVFAHYYFARYQSERDTIVKYELDSPIVRKLPELFERTDMCIDSINLYAELAYQRKDDLKKIISLAIKKRVLKDSDNQS